MLALSLSALWSGQTVTADTLARNIESAGDSPTVIRCLLIVSASEPATDRRPGNVRVPFSRRHLAHMAKQYVEAREMRRCPTNVWVIDA